MTWHQRFHPKSAFRQEKRYFVGRFLEQPEDSVMATFVQAFSGLDC